MDWVVMGSRALVASSHKSTSGSLARARAMATRCFWPAGELGGIGVRLVLKADDLEKLHDSLVGLRLGNPGDLQGIAHVARPPSFASAG